MTNIHHSIICHDKKCLILSVTCSQRLDGQKVKLKRRGRKWLKIRDLPNFTSEADIDIYNKECPATEIMQFLTLFKRGGGQTHIKENVLRVHLGYF